METIKERPILFKTEMVAAIFDGRKTQTRRIIKPQPIWHPKKRFWNLDQIVKGQSFSWEGDAPPTDITKYCPYGKIGDRLWLKETYCQGVIAEADTIDGYSEGCYVSQCPNENDIIMKEYCIRHGITTEDVIWKPSIFMFRKYSRILLEITDIRVEQIQDITIEDVFKEGIKDVWTWPGTLSPAIIKDIEYVFSKLWDSINAKPKPVMSGKKIVSYISYPWDDIRETREHRGLKWIVYGNPHVWAVTFKVLKKEV